MSRRVAYVCADPGIPVFGTKGASVHVQELIRAWRARGDEVEVFCARVGEEIPADLADARVTCRTVRVGKEDPAARERAQIEGAALLARDVTDGGFDVVHERYSLFSSVLADVPGDGLVRILEVNSPLIEEQRAHRVLVDEASAWQVLDRQLTAADVVACVSEPVADWVRRRCPGQGGPIVVVTPNGVNPERIRPVGDAPAGVPVVVFVGTLKPWHGIDLLLDAQARANQGWRLRIIGDGPMRGQVEQKMAELGLDVELVGAVPPEQVPARLEGASVAVAPYPASDDHYFSPLKVYEYSAAALPVVASDIGEIHRVVQDGQTGLLVPPSDVSALATAIDSLVADLPRARMMGLRGRALMESEHSWHHVLARTLAPLPDRRVFAE